jgi:hypothetical protein
MVKSTFMNWLWENRTWLFSGVGVSALTALVWFVRRLWVPAKQPSITAEGAATIENASLVGSPVAMGPNISEVIHAPPTTGISQTQPTQEKIRSEIEGLGTIRFDYLPVSPLENGWTSAYKHKPDGVCQFGTDHDINDSLRMEVTASEFAMDYTVPVHMTLAKRVMFTAKYDNRADIGKQTMVFVYVEVSTKNGEQRKRVWFKFYYGDKHAYPTSGVSPDPNKQLPEQTVYWPAVPHNGQLEFDIDLPEAVRLTLGAQGWIYRGVYKVRLRGNLSISPIKFAN